MLWLHIPIKPNAADEIQHNLNLEKELSRGGFCPEEVVEEYSGNDTVNDEGRWDSLNHNPFKDGSGIPGDRSRYIVFGCNVIL